MNVPRLVAIGFIYVCTVVAWSILGGSVVQRTGEFDQRLAEEVAQLWGGRHNQVAPEAWCPVPRTVVEGVEEKDSQGRVTRRQVSKTVVDIVPMALESSRISVGMGLDQRQKGLLWFNTYGVDLKARYRFRDTVGGRPAFVSFAFPSAQAIYDGFAFKVNGQDVKTADISKGIVAPVSLPPDGTALVEVGYRSRGLG
jgi:hypothetical protein